MSRNRSFHFTVNNYTDDDVAELRKISSKVKYLVFGKEISSSGTPHLQGFVVFPNPRRLSSLHSLLPSHGHWSALRTSEYRSSNYCKKEGDFEEYGVSPRETRKGQGKRSDLEAVRDLIKAGETDTKKLRDLFPCVCAKYGDFVHRLILDQISPPELELFPLRDWQSELYQVLKRSSDKRPINFVVDPKGNSGKSWFILYVEKFLGNTIHLLPGKKADMVYAFINQLTANTRICFIDCPRSKQGEFIQYDFLEEIKNGCVFNTKYRSDIVRFPTIHVVVMMNEQPDETKLSEDRYKIINI